MHVYSLLISAVFLAVVVSPALLGAGAFKDDADLELSALQSGQFAAAKAPPAPPKKKTARVIMFPSPSERERFTPTLPRPGVRPVRTLTSA